MENELDIDRLTQPTPEQIAGWKKAYGKIREIKITGADDDGSPQEMTFCFKMKFQGKIALIESANKRLASSKSVLAYQRIIVEGCLINGLSVIREDEEVFLALSSQVDKIITSYTSDLVNG
jgi:hypothetical protein